MPPGSQTLGLTEDTQCQIQQRWLKEYLRSHQSHYCWKLPGRNLQVGDMGLWETGLGKQHIPIGRITQTFPGSGGLVREVQIYSGDDEFKKAVQKLVMLVHSNSAPKCP